MKRFLNGLSLLLSISLPCSAQLNSQANQNANLNLSNAIAVTFVPTGTSTGNTVNLDFNTTNDYVNGVSSSPQQLKVQSNKHYNVSISSSSLNFTYQGLISPAPTMQISNVLKFLVSNNSTGSLSYSSYTYVPYGTATIINWCSPGGNNTFDVTYLAIPGYSYPAGRYTANIIYTATQQ
jgi:hypothetical protein